MRKIFGESEFPKPMIARAVAGAGERGPAEPVSLAVGRINRHRSVDAFAESGARVENFVGKCHELGALKNLKSKRVHSVHKLLTF